MISVDTVRRKAARLARRRRDLSVGELRDWFELLDCDETGSDNWAVFRTAYFDALWAGAEEMTPPPVVPPTSFPKGKRLSDCAHLTLAFVATHRLELVDLAIEDEG
ncbi:MAG TPA: hypothetical protein VES20_05825 [Bryobacteraceae bacterium]|nr:hypothetical protein [Bryobacteraceae bacterium]